MRGVNVDMNGTEVTGVVLKNLEAIWGVGSMVGYWVENKQSTYVLVPSIPEREWLSNVGGTQVRGGVTLVYCGVLDSRWWLARRGTM